MDNAVWLTLLLPVLGALTVGFFGRSLGRAGTATVACAAVGLAFGAAVLTAMGADGETLRAPFSWVFLDTVGLKASLGALRDPLTATMLLVVTGVGFLIHCYSAGYMGEEPDYPRYFAFLNLFIVAMVTLVIADSMPMLLMGWGGVGFASYALIGFYWRRPSAVKAARKAFVINLIGDLGMLLAIFGTAAVTGGNVSLDPDNLARVAASDSTGWIALMLLVAAYAKSAQLPLHTWLPDAMEGPTPVSALIHAATMVTAGVYLVVRVHPIFEAAPAMLAAVALLGAVSSFYAATAALTQTDLKRVLAYSTMSQLGYMFMAAGVGAYAAAMFHLVTHAFFKALLFLTAGIVIHALHDEQDMRRMGGVGPQIPVAYWSFLIGALAISGIPLLSGYFSKDLILESTFAAGAHGLPGGQLVWAAGIVTAMLTAFYMFRAFFLTFHGTPRFHEGSLHLPGMAMTWPVAVLGVLAVVGGVINLPTWVPGPTPNVLTDFLSPPVTVVHPSGVVPAWVEHGAAAHAPAVVAFGVPLGAALGGLALAWILVLNAPPPEEGRETTMARFLKEGWGIDAAYGYISLAFHFLANLFRGPLETFASVLAPEGLAESVQESGRAVGMMQSGYVRAYALALLLGLGAFVGWALMALAGGAR